MAPRGLSADEKRVKLLEIFHETRDFYQLKELEKLGPKMKGIVSQSVKEVLQSLVDDGLVQSDKIGASNFFWSFPSQQGTMVSTELDLSAPFLNSTGCFRIATVPVLQLQGKLATAMEAKNSYVAQINDVKEQLTVERAARIESDSRSKRLSRLVELRKHLVELEKELNTYGDCDPAVIEEKKRAVFLAKEAALRWTDNYGSLLTYFTRQNCIEAEEVRKYLGISEDYEDLA